MTSVWFAASAKALFSGARDDAIKVWDLGSGVELRSIGGHKADVRCVQPLQDDSLLLSASLDGTVQFTQLGALGEEGGAPPKQDVLTAILTAQPQALRLGEDAGAALGAPADTPLHAFLAHEGSTFAMALNPAFPMVATAGRSNEVKLWDISEPTEPRVLQETVGHSGQVTAVLLCSKDAWVATASKQLAEPRTFENRSLVDESRVPCKLSSGVVNAKAAHHEDPEPA